jgi:hypothetical protein
MLKAIASTTTKARRRQGSDVPDLQTQLESLLDQVWRSEAEWRLYDRIDAFCASQPDRCGVEDAGR